jgi:type IX secretion system PorP/SprF family membrane protein
MTYGSASLSYHKALDEDGFNTIGAGLQATYSSLNINMNKLTFADQLTQNGFTGTTAEVLKRGNNQNYVDMNAGVLFSGSSDGYNNYYGGISLYHINKPVVGFQDNNWTLSPRITIHGGGAFPLSNQIGINFSAIQQFQNSASETELGAAFSGFLNSDPNDDYPTKIYAGSWYRVGDAIIPYVGIEFYGLRIGLSYDINTSALKPATQSMGGSEFSLIYIKKALKSKGIPCPSF